MVDDDHQRLQPYEDRLRRATVCLFGRIPTFSNPPMLLLLLSRVLSEVFFEERFNRGWEKRWIKSQRVSPGKLLGRFRVSAGSFYVDRREQRGLQTLDDGRQYLISSKFKRCFNTSGRDFILQFTLKLENKVEKASGYLKVLPESFKPNQFSSKSPWRIIFGPDIKQWDRKHIDFRVYRNRTEYRTDEPILCFEDKLTHIYTLVIYANQSYKVLKDNFTDIESHIEDAFHYAPPREVPDPDAVKPDDWEDIETIDDPDDVPPPWVENVPQYIPDDSAKRPADWDDETQGAWTPPLVSNPAYRRDWKPRQIPNPAFRGDWIPINVSNPDYVGDPKFGKAEDLCYIGIDVEQDVAGSIWDNILVTDDFEYAQKMLAETWAVYQDRERATWKQHEAAEKEKSEKKIQEVEFGPDGGPGTGQLPSQL
jgi:calreticulin